MQKLVPCSNGGLSHAHGNGNPPRVVLWDPESLGHVAPTLSRYDTVPYFIVKDGRDEIAMQKVLPTQTATSAAGNGATRGYAREELAASSLKLELADGSSLEETVEYPIGHRRRWKEGIPLLEAKFKTNLAWRFPHKQQAKIVGVSLNQRFPGLRQMQRSPTRTFEKSFNKRSALVNCLGAKREDRLFTVDGHSAGLLRNEG
jgi:hypothetical protein